MGSLESISSPAIQTSNEVQTLLDICADMLSAISQRHDKGKSLGENTIDSKGLQVAFIDILLRHKLAARTDHGGLEITDNGRQFLEEYISLSRALD